MNKDETAISILQKMAAESGKDLDEFRNTLIEHDEIWAKINELAKLCNIDLGEEK